AVIIAAAESKAKETIVELRESMQGLVRSYESLVEQRELLVKSLRRISQDMLNQIDLSDAHFNRIDAKAHARAVDELSRSQAFTFANIESLTEQLSQSMGNTQVKVEEEVVEDPMEEMEIIEEEIEIEIHDSTPDVQPEMDGEEEVSKESEELQQQYKETKKAEIKKNQQAPSKPQDDANQSGSFFDQFD
ncbi:MAG: cell division initiation protein DivIVA, partial [Algoriphagus marincola HL-49]